MPATQVRKMEGILGSLEYPRGYFRCWTCGHAVAISNRAAQPCRRCGYRTAVRCRRAEQRQRFQGDALPAAARPRQHQAAMAVRARL